MAFGTSLMADIRSLWSDMSIDDMHKLAAIFASIADEFDTCDCLGFEINHTAAMDQILCAQSRKIYFCRIYGLLLQNFDFAIDKYYLTWYNIITKRNK